MKRPVYLIIVITILLLLFVVLKQSDIRMYKSVISYYSDESNAGIVLSANDSALINLLNKEKTFADSLDTNYYDRADTVSETANYQQEVEVNLSDVDELKTRWIFPFIKHADFNNKIPYRWSIHASPDSTRVFSGTGEIHMRVEGKFYGKCSRKAVKEIMIQFLNEKAREEIKLKLNEILK